MQQEKKMLQHRQQSNVFKEEEEKRGFLVTVSIYMQNTVGNHAIVVPMDMSYDSPLLPKL
jgi:hypothetical protein